MSNCVELLSDIAFQRKDSNWTGPFASEAEAIKEAEYFRGRGHHLLRRCGIRYYICDGINPATRQLVKQLIEGAYWKIT